MCRKESLAVRQSLHSQLPAAYLILYFAKVHTATKFCYYITRQHKLGKFYVHESAHRKCITKYNQEDANLHNLFISTQCSTCLRRFLRPSSGAHKCTYSIGHLSKLYCYLPLSRMSWKSSTIAAGSSNGLTNARCCMYSCELLMMGGGTA